MIALGDRLPNLGTIFVVLLVASCGDPPPFLRTDSELVSFNMSGDRYEIPANYLVVYELREKHGSGTDGAFLAFSWPDMNGRPSDGNDYKRYAKNNIRVRVSASENYENQVRALDASYLRMMTKPKVGPISAFSPPVRKGTFLGYEHFERRLTRHEKFGSSDYSTIDIYARRNDRGELEALMECQGEPAPQGRNPQCNLRVIFPQFEGTGFSITFSRRQALNDVRRVERSVKEKFSHFSE